MVKDSNMCKESGYSIFKNTSGQHHKEYTTKSLYKSAILFVVDNTSSATTHRIHTG